MKSKRLRAPTIIGLAVSMAVIAAVMVNRESRQSTMSEASTMTIYSQAFSEGGEIPVDYTCDGQGKSPALTFGNVPDGSKSLTLILEDPDAPQGTFTHWLVFNIPPDTVTVDEELPTTTPTFGLPGRNSAGSESYVGPCPPNGQHRYYFTLYALDTTLPLEAGTTKEQVMAAMVGHVIAETRLMGRYGAERRKI